MKNKVVLGVFLAVFLFSLISAASAEILLGQPSKIYMLGSNFEQQVDILESDSATGLLQLTLVCPSQSVVFYADTVSVSANTLFELKKGLVLTDGIGECHVTSSFLSESARTSNFIVSDNIKLDITLSAKSVKPGEQLVINGNAIREDGIPVNGFAEISVGDVAKQTIAVVDGSFTINLNIPENARPDAYDIEILVYEKYKDTRTNKAVFQDKIYVTVVPTKLELALNNDSFIPGSILTVKALLYDQAGNEIKDIVRLEIYDSRGNNLVQEGIETSLSKNYQIPNNATAGDWKIYVSISDLREERIIYIPKYESASVELVNNKLVVTNTGNVPYKKTLEIKFSSGGTEIDKTKKVVLDVDDKQSFLLEAPNGTYDVSVNALSDGTETIEEVKEFRSVPLTGRATAVLDLEGRKGLFTQYPLISFIVFIILIIFIIYISRPKQELDYVESKGVISRGQGTGYIVATSSLPIQARDAGKSEDVIRRIYDKYVDKSLVEKVVQGSIVGNRQELSVLFVSLKNLSEIQKDDNFTELINKYFRIVTNAVYGNRGVVGHVAGSDIIALFNAPRTQENHQLAAVRAATRINEELSKLEVEHGLGINSGQAAVGLNAKVLRFMPTAGLSLVAQKLKEKSRNEILVSKSINDVARDYFKIQRYGVVDAGVHVIEAFKVVGAGGAFTSEEKKESSLADMISRVKLEQEKKEAEKRLQRGSQ
ncbi:hypothetical protein HZA33_00040 [Candidatus Pacearchaeota archaeon]|nr:hypothetical protein [Candidatus Pacearchaeota archaeon]